MAFSQNLHNLEAWFKKNQRVLPWRETQDPYKIWISEIMLQQTQVAVVIPYYERFLEAFPTIQDLAQATLDSVYAKWSGLGYYSRARNLKKGAEYLVDKHRGKFPRTREEILEVPGIGPYTAGAILSIAYNLPIPLVDGNVMRVFARFFGFKEEIESKKAHAFFWKKATEWVENAQSPRILNQAIMELGATICTKAAPKCEFCPIFADCIAQKKSLQSVLPARKPRKKIIKLNWEKYIYEHNDSLFLKTNTKGEWWEGLLDFPIKPLKIRAKEKSKTELQHQEHTVTHHKIHITPIHYKLKTRAHTKTGKWYPKNELPNLPLSALAKKIIRSLL